MQRADPSPSPSPCPARRTEWVVSALAYHYGLDRGVENEIIVLATGLDQYLQEIFHHLDLRGQGTISSADLRALCRVLALEPGSQGEEEAVGLLEALPDRLSFKQFHAKLCGYFSTKAGCQYHTGRLLVGSDSELIETQIRLRGPLTGRRGALGRSPAPAGPGVGQQVGGGSSPSSPPPRRYEPCSRECYEDIVALEAAEDKVAKLELENASLRQLVEELRAALQSSDARALALQVGLCKSRQVPDQDPHTDTPARVASDVPQLNPTGSSAKLLKEGRMQEALRLSQEMERELRRSEEALLTLEESNRRLEREQLDTRQRVGKARQAVLRSFQKVKELESQAKEVPSLQRSVLQLQCQLRYYRSEVIKLQFLQPITPEVRAGPGSEVRQVHCSPEPQERGSPTGQTEIPVYSDDEQLLRSVEGQAASDEEDEKWTEDQQSRVAEVKKVLARLCCCGNGCDDQTVRKLLWQFGSGQSEESSVAILELVEKVARLTQQLEWRETQASQMATDMEQLKGSLVCELQRKVVESEQLQTELQMLETERVRLSLIEEKLLDVLLLLQQLRHLNFSRRSLGKILLNTLESCSDPQHGKAHILEVLNTLYQELAACELLSDRPLDKTQGHRSLANTLLISC
eukprot:gi/632970237/ref/XP_007901537.1/ PREDICTED: EF-hand and coiled-coil domain-containing protein 1 isoform X1 [Callorhinchus milii]